MCVSYFSFLYDKIPEERKLKSGKVEYAPEFQSQSNHSGEDMPSRAVHHVDEPREWRKNYSISPVARLVHLST